MILFTVIGLSLTILYQESFRNSIRIKKSQLNERKESTLKAQIYKLIVKSSSKLRDSIHNPLQQEITRKSTYGLYDFITHHSHDTSTYQFFKVAQMIYLNEIPTVTLNTNTNLRIIGDGYIKGTIALKKGSIIPSSYQNKYPKNTNWIKKVMLLDSNHSYWQKTLQIDNQKINSWFNEQNKILNKEKTVQYDWIKNNQNFGTYIHKNGI